MRMLKYIALRTVLACGCLLGSPLAAQPTQTAPHDAALAYVSAFNATVFGYPLLGMYARLTEEVLEPANRKAPFNTYYHYTRLATPEVSPFPAPNNDTLYSTAWLDLRKEPAIIGMPDTGGRYYTAHIMDMTTETIANVGQRLNGTRAGKFAVVGPGWRGELPPGLSGVIRSQTSFAYVLLRILVDGPNDVPVVNDLQRRFSVASLSRHRRGADGIDAGEPVPPYGAQDTKDRLSMLDRVLRMSPVQARDEGMVASFAPLGIGPTESSLRLAPTPETLGTAEREARASIASIGPRTGRIASGWRLPPSAIGRYGVDYLQRASVWDGGPLANVVEESFYPAALLDSRNRPLDGASNRYTLRFAPGGLPPARAFWSLTMYKLDDKLLVPNPINRYSIGNRTRGLVRGADGGLTIAIQADPPADPSANWLPAPRQNFYMVLRLYTPSQEALSGAWLPPPVVRVE